MKLLIKLPFALMAITFPFFSYGFDSGSTGADGAFNPASNIQLQLPPSGIFNFTEVNIPASVIVSFAKNAGNTPVTILVSGDVTVDGEINVNGRDNNASSPGIGGPGGFDGGRGGLRAATQANEGGAGQGPGGGGGAPRGSNGRRGGGASYGFFGQSTSGHAPRGQTYGNSELLPLIGGSGGGASGGGSSPGISGGGGGGAILIAASGTMTITVNASISAIGGGAPGGSSVGNDAGFAGAGSGGAIRLVATTIQGEGTITALGSTSGLVGGAGRIRLEAENFLRDSSTTPAFTFSTPSLVLIANLPNLRITSVGGVAAPSVPSGNRDVELPGVTTNPVTVVFETTNVPLGTTIAMTAAPERGTATTANSVPVSGTLNLGTASANINLPNGNSILSAQTSFTVTASLGKDFSKYAQGEQVEKVRVGINPEGQSETTFITISGKEFTFPSNTIAMH